MGSTINSAFAETPMHLFWADDMVQHVSQDKNAYATGTSYMRWPNADEAGFYENYTKCSTFITLVMMKSYGWTNSTFTNWMASTSPSSDKYFDAINSENGFLKIDTIDEIIPGDIIAIKYPTGSTVTGHTMIVRSVATPRIAKSPIVPNTYQYEIQVIDSSQTGHGPTDTRMKPDGSFDPGAGIGVLRLYVNSSAALVGYAWSTYSTSTFYDTSSRPIALGRLNKL
ncbi:MAG: hypothetical protein IPN42_12495 [Methylococcaceae bacterium]|nr:hypothetical protein [Methylococcaceae bacterium]